METIKRGSIDSDASARVERQPIAFISFNFKQIWSRYSYDTTTRSGTIEDGWVCTRPISYTSVCSEPMEATIQFQAIASNVTSSSGRGASRSRKETSSSNTLVRIEEGKGTNVWVERIGDNSTSCEVTYTTIDSTATHLPRTNNEWTAGGATPAKGDYQKVNGTLSFAPFELTKKIRLQTNLDGTYDGSSNEVFVLRLTGTTCGGGLAGGASALDM